MISAHRPEGPFEALSYHILRKKGNSPIAARKMKATRISRVHGPRRSQQANGRANIIATRRLPGGQPQQRMWRGGRDAAITSAPELARAARLPPSGRRAQAPNRAGRRLFSASFGQRLFAAVAKVGRMRPHALRRRALAWLVAAELRGVGPASLADRRRTYDRHLTIL
jgi:hypothetical protein